MLSQHLQRGLTCHKQRLTSCGLADPYSECRNPAQIYKKVTLVRLACSTSSLGCCCALSAVLACSATAAAAAVQAGKLGPGVLRQAACVQGIRPAALQRVRQPGLAELISLCIAPQRERPHAKKLLKHAYFSSIREVRRACSCTYPGHLQVEPRDSNLSALLAGNACYCCCCCLFCWLQEGV